MQTIRLLIQTMRLPQWSKNFFVFAALIFSKNLFALEKFFVVTLGFFFFCLCSSAIYLVNDIRDREHDRLHPKKATRPIARGDLSPTVAGYAAFFLLLVSILSSMCLSYSFAVILIIYMILNVSYSFGLKNVVILDVACISFGFVCRVCAGSVIINVSSSQWLLLCTFLLACFLAFGKRRHELVVLHDGHAESHRAVLKEYSPYFLDQMISIITTSTVFSYILYTMSQETIDAFQTTHLFYTVPFVFYGVFRYLYLIHKKHEGGDPLKVLLRDTSFLVNMICWIITSVIIIYVNYICAIFS